MLYLDVRDLLASESIWLDECLPTAEEMGTLTRVTREKCEAFPGYYFIGYRHWITITHQCHISVFRECISSLEVDAIDELVLILKQNVVLRRIGHAQKRGMVFLRLLITTADVITAVIKRCAQCLAPESDSTLYLRDMQDQTMMQNLNHCDKTHIAILGRLNIITGLWCMNVKVLREQEEVLSWFLGIVTGMILIACSQQAR
ncbi:hypothetical protein BC830DRAFT_1213614 [Chytriomyces sp. MP71]|nr:hypothetical protein BC830DRAFT_1213614 [Chytriomyces sp. MP71]